MKCISDTQAAYIAGIIDGEGTITICKHSSGNINHALRYSPFVGVSNTNNKLMDYLLITTGIGKVRTRHDERGNRKADNQWTVERGETKIFLERALPFLVIKIEQAKILLEFLDTFKGYNRFNPTSTKHQAIRSILCEEIQALNLKGK